MSEFAPIEPEEERDQGAAREQELYEQVRTVFADLFHACSLRRRDSGTVSIRALRVTTETRGPICPGGGDGTFTGGAVFR